MVTQEKLALEKIVPLLDTKIKTTLCIRIQSQWLKPYIEFNTQGRIKTEKNNSKDGKAMNNAIYRKTIKNLRNRIDFKTSKQQQQKNYLKCTSRPSYVSHKIFDNNLFAIRKSKIALKLNKPAYMIMCILELSKILINVRISL